MGNQREIRQVEPRRCLGAVVRVRPGSADKVRVLLETLAGHYYTYFKPAGEPVAFPNLDGPDADLGVLAGDHVAIQSGGKMWCGYEEFVAHLGELAAYLEDALFYVGDEEDYIDEFRIRAGRLEYRRVHQGGWWAVEDFLISTGRGT
jgi:hypothetical protein